jgi:hypothetical protein
MNIENLLKIKWLVQVSTEQTADFLAIAEAYLFEWQRRSSSMTVSSSHPASSTGTKTKEG